MIFSLTAALLQASAQPMALPNWMSGAWIHASGGDWTEEWWTPPRAGIMLGASRAGKGQALGFFEHMRVARTTTGVEFCALPQGRAGGCFAAVAGDGRSITFENRAHDYPQRITYRKVGAELHADISLADGSRKQSWKYKRMGGPP